MTRLALAQRASLASELAAVGVDCHTVVVADDENLEVAREHGFATVEMDNDHGLGRRFNAGYRFAAEQGADWLVHIGSDDWLHPDVLVPLTAPLEPRPIISGRRIAFVDLPGGRMRRTALPGATGVIPWVLPRHLLERCGFEPIRPDRNAGMDGSLVRGLQKARARAQWVFHDPHDVARVDFKSDTNINAWQRVATIGSGVNSTDPWTVLAERYPRELVELARETHLELREAALCRG